MTREEWMTKIVDAARPVFEELGAPLPMNVRACLAPPQRKMKAVGLCWHGNSTSDEGREIWVSSAHDDPMEIAGILIHELAHAALPDGTGHKAPFGKLARKLHLEGKLTATTIGEEFKAQWSDVLAAIGPVPGAKFIGELAIGRKKQATIPLKNVTCPDCGFFARIRCDQIPIGRLRCPADDELLLMKEELK